MISPTIEKLKQDFKRMTTSSLLVLKEQITSVIERELLEAELESRTNNQFALGPMRDDISEPEITVERGGV